MTTPTISPEYVWRWQCDPIFDEAGNVTGTPLQVFYRKDLDLGDGSKAFINSESGMTVDLVKDAAKTITVGDVTHSYGEIVQSLIAIVAQERAAG